MNPETLIEIVKQKVEAFLSTEPDLFLVEVKVKPTNNIKVFFDGDQGVSIEKLVQYNRRLYKEMEESALFPNGDFSLEVSSPGLEEPLKLHRQYVKNIGRFVEITEQDESKKEGKLLSVNEQAIEIEEQKGKGKKLEIVRHTIPFENIKMTKIQIKF